MLKKSFLAAAFLAALTATFAATNNTYAAGFNPGNIISDSEMGNYDSMSEASIQSFLRSKCNRLTCLGYKTINGESASHIIYRAAQDYSINPKVIIVLLQKEQSLITGNATATRLRKATGYGCPDTAACDAKYYGFKNQVRNAAALFRSVLNGGWSNYRIGYNFILYHPNRSCGGSTVYIANRATSALYRYTPYQPNAALLKGSRNSCSSYGNYNFYNYYISWFGSTGGSGTTVYKEKFVIPEMHSAYLPAGTFAIKSISGKSLSFESHGHANGTQAKITNYQDNSEYHFKFLKSGEFYKIRHEASGRFLDVDSAGTADGNKIQLHDENDTCAQKWAVEIDGDNHYRFRSACSGKALDINGGNINSSGVKVQLWSENHSEAQLWDLVNLSAAPVRDGDYNLKTLGAKNLSLYREYTDNGTTLETGVSLPAISQIWRLEHRSDGYYRVINLAANRSLDVSGASKSNGAKVQIYDHNNSCAQRWVIKRSGDDYRLVNACSGKSLDINNGDLASENVRVQLYDNNDTNAQKWRFSSPESPELLEEGNYELFSSVRSDAILSAWKYNTPHPGTNILIWYSDSAKYKTISIKYHPADHTYNLINDAGYALDVKDGNRLSGANVQLWDYNNSCAQKWYYKAGKFYNVCSRNALSTINYDYVLGANVFVTTPNNSREQNWVLKRILPPVPQPAQNDDQPDNTSGGESTGGHPSTNQPSDSQSSSEPQSIPALRYTAYVENYGWMTDKSADQPSTATGKSRYLEGLRVFFPDNKYNNQLLYRAYVEGSGWTDWVSGWKFSGSTTATLRAIEIKLDGDLAEEYDINYQVYASNLGWLDWAKNGSTASAPALSDPLESFRIKLTHK